MTPEHRVAIVVDDALAPELEDLARSRHVWAVRTPEVEASLSVYGTSRLALGPTHFAAGLTLFNADETPERSILSILDTFELHHGEYSHVPPVSVIEVLGTGITDAIRDVLTALSFTEIRPSTDGFTARRVTG